MKIPHHKTLRTEFIDLLHEAEKGPVPVRTVLKLLSGKGKELLLILLSIPFCLPLQIPGLSTIFGLAILFVSLRLGLGKKIWAPKFILKKKIPPKVLEKIVHTGNHFLNKIRKFTHPRLRLLCDHPIFHWTNVVLLVFWGFFLALPLPIPFTNLIAGWTILLLSIGLLEDDGGFILAAYFVTSLIVFLFVDFV